MRVRRWVVRGAAAAALALGTTGGSLVTAAPAGACYSFGGNAWWNYGPGTVPYAVAHDYKQNWGCNDVNIDYVSQGSYYRGYYNAGGWTPGAVGWVSINHGYPNPWVVVVSSVYTGTPVTSGTNTLYGVGITMQV